VIKTLGYLAQLAVCFYLSGCRSVEQPAIDQFELFTAGEGAYHTYRIPSVITTEKGTVLAFCEGRLEGRGDSGNIDIVLRRSEDGGQTWNPLQVVCDNEGNTCGNPTPVVDRTTGTIWLLMTWNHGSDSEGQIMDGTATMSRRIWVTRSDDDGITWDEPEDITATVKQPHWRWYATGPGNGIQLSRGPFRNRMVIPANHSDHSEATLHPYRSHVIYSDDAGATWHVGGILDPQTNESTIVELPGGKIMDNMRSYAGLNRRAISVSRDGGQTWSQTWHDSTLVEPVCQASILRYSWQDEGQSRILFSNPSSTSRENMTVHVSYDEGESWPVSRSLYRGPAAYSNLTVLPDGDIACLYERGRSHPYETIVFSRFPIRWLTEEQNN